MSELKQERTFKRFNPTADGSAWDLTEVVDEHSDHIEKLELALELQGHVIGRLVGIIERMHEWQHDIAGELDLALNINVSPEEIDAQ